MYRLDLTEFISQTIQIYTLSCISTWCLHFSSGRDSINPILQRVNSYNIPKRLKEDEQNKCDPLRWLVLEQQWILIISFFYCWLEIYPWKEGPYCYSGFTVHLGNCMYLVSDSSVLPLGSCHSKCYVPMDIWYPCPMAAPFSKQLPKCFWECPPYCQSEDSAFGSFLGTQAGGGSQIHLNTANSLWLQTPPSTLCCVF